MHPLLLAAVLSCGILSAGSATHAAPGDRPVWLLANGFHTSLVLRTRDVPYWRQISGPARSDALAFGWGASDSYWHDSFSVLSVLAAIPPNRAALHVVPIRGSLARRFPHSDLVLLMLSRSQHARLVANIRRSFADDPAGHPLLLGQGYFPDSHFYVSRERFYFPYVCSMWVAMKLRRSGVPLNLPRSILADSLIIQASPLGLYYQKKQEPTEAY